MDDHAKKKKKSTEEKDRKILAFKECYDKISGIDKAFRLKHKKKL